MSRVYKGENLEEFIFSEGTSYEEKITNEELNKFGVIECTEDNINIAYYNIAIENENNFNAVYQSIMLEKFNALESSEMIHEADESVIKKIINKIKEVIQKFWARVQGVFKKIVDTISAVKNNAEIKVIVKKYKGKDLKMPEKRFVPGYDFEDTSLKDKMIYDNAEKITREISTLGTAISKSYTTSPSGIIDQPHELDDFDEYKHKGTHRNLDIQTINTDLDKLYDRLRGALCNKNQISKEEYDKELQLAFFGSIEKKNIELLPFKQLISELETFSEVEKIVRDAYNSMKKWTERSLTLLKEYENKATKLNHSNKLKYLNILSNSMSECIVIMNKAITVVSSACLEKVAQDKAMVKYYIKNQPEEN